MTRSHGEEKHWHHICRYTSHRHTRSTFSTPERPSYVCAMCHLYRWNKHRTGEKQRVQNQEAFSLIKSDTRRKTLFNFGPIYLDWNTYTRMNWTQIVAFLGLLGEHGRMGSRVQRRDKMFTKHQQIHSTHSTGKSGWFRCSRCLWGRDEYVANCVYLECIENRTFLLSRCHKIFVRKLLFDLMFNLLLAYFVRAFRCSVRHACTNICADRTRLTGDSLCN